MHKNMIQLRLTQKVQKAAGFKADELTDVQDCSAGLGSWTVNLFTQDRRKVLVFVNDRTLYSFVLFGVRKEHYKTLNERFSHGFQQLLAADGFTLEEQKYLMQGCENINYTKTNSRQVLGNLNDLIWHYQNSIYDEGGLDYSDIGAIIHRLNRMPQKNLEWVYSIDAVSKIVAIQNKSFKRDNFKRGFAPKFPLH